MSNPEYSDKYVSLDRPDTDVSPALPRGVLAGSAIIIICTVLAYYPSLRGGFMLDDTFLLTDNYLIKAPDGPYRFWFTNQALEYYPVTNTMLWLEWRVWGINPTGYRAVNLIFHIADVFLIWFILRKLSIPGAFLAALIFAVHPVNVESVAWISQLRNVLTLFFSLLSIWCYLKADMSTASVGMAPETSPWPLTPSPSPLFYWLSLTLFILAMLSKGTSAVLPAMLLGIIWWLRPLTRRDLVRTAPFFAVAAVLSLVNVWFQTHGSGEVIRTAGFTERLLGAGGIVWFYLYKALLPYDLIFVYPQWQIRIGNPLWWLPLIAALAVTAVLWRYRKGWSRPFLFAWGFFCVSLAPVMGFADVGFMKYSLVADHYQHIAIIGVIALVAAGYGLWRRNARKVAIRAASAIAVMAVGTLVFLTWLQTCLYADVLELYKATLGKNPNCWMIHNNLGIALDRAGRTKEAVEHYQQALYIKPDYSDAHDNMGIFLMDEGRLPEAIEHFRQAIKYKPQSPDAYNNLGLAWSHSGRVQEAIFNFKQALSKNPYYAETYYNMGLSLDNTDQVQGAIDNYEQALRLKPDFASAS